MKQHRHLPLLAAIALAAGAAPASAGSITLSTGRVEPDRGGFDAATTASVRYGLEILDAGLAEFDLEFEGVTTLDSGDAPNGSEYDFTSLGVGLSARTAGPVYAIGRYGIARNEIDIDGGGDTSENQQSIGLGVGGSVGLLQVELLATQYLEEGDLDDITWLTASIRF